MKQYNELPKDIQDRIREHLKVFPKVEVYYEYGEYRFGICLKKHYAPYHEFIGTFKDTDIFTEEERTENYIENFHDYPIWYKGKRDYKALRERFNK